MVVSDSPMSDGTSTIRVCLPSARVSSRVATWPCAQGDFSASCAMSSYVVTHSWTHDQLSLLTSFTPPPYRVGSPATMCPKTRDRLLCHHVSQVPRPTPMPPCIPGPVSGSRATTCINTHGQLSYLCPLRGGLLCRRVSWDSHPFPCRHVSQHTWPTFLSLPLAGWTPMLPCVVEPVVSFLLSTPLRGGLLYCHMSLNPWTTSFSPPPCEVGSPTTRCT
jgi:hypothetical protein